MRFRIHPVSLVLFCLIIFVGCGKTPPVEREEPTFLLNNGLVGQTWPFVDLVPVKEDIPAPTLEIRYDLYIAFSMQGCNECLTSITEVLGSIDVGLQRDFIRVVGLGFGQREELKGFTRGFVAENPDLGMFITEEPMPATWNALQHPHILLVDHNTNLVLLDLRLSKSEGKNLQESLGWLRRVLTESDS